MTDNVKNIVTNKLKELARNEIRMSFRRAEQGLPVGCSKIGGNPDVPQDFKWDFYLSEDYAQVRKNRPLSFTAQINLRDIAELDTENMLPKTGVLSFFYELETMKWGFDPADKGCARVYYFPDESVLAPMNAPDDIEEYFILPEFSLDFEKRISLPDWEYCGSIGIPDCSFDDYEEIIREIGADPDGAEEVTKLLGYPNVIQNLMEEECESTTRGVYNGGTGAYDKLSDEEKADIKAKSADWTLLFQMSTVGDDDFELMFGDCGSIYYWIRKSDLASLNFADTWLILQCF